uniref:WD_REPEATS_REGION domain-containing protein n=2 Tax=Mesocestoides corti TaxID=53468 RepID=A0A5K3EVI9_MESCO
RGYGIVFSNYSDLRDRFFQIDLANLKLRRENKALERENQRLSVQAETSALANPARNAELEQKLLHLQGEVIELHREKEKLNELIQTKNSQLQNQAERIEKLNDLLLESNALNRSCMESIDELKKANEMLLNEQTTTMLTVKSLEADKRQMEEDRTRFLTQISSLQTQIESLKNFESDMKLRLRRETVHRGLLDAASLPASVEEGDHGSIHRSSCSLVPLPDQMVSSIVTSEDVNCVRFSPSGRMLSYGGLDRKVWLASVKGDKCESLVSLVGCNAGVTDVDFDCEETMVLGASSDFACRVWTLADRRLKVNLTGHSERVVAARFISCGNASNSVATASSDRTIKLWNVGRRQCSRTIPLTSLCYDVIGCRHSSSLISGHSDKKLRIWDPESGKLVTELVLSGRITGLDVSTDGNYVLACTRNDSLHTVELRRNEVVRSFQAEGFRIHADCVRPAFSPDGAHVTCGSQSGGVYVWNAITGDLETVLNGHDNMVICANWSPLGSHIVTCERGKKIALWSHTASG